MTLRIKDISLTTPAGFELIRRMAAAEDKSWEYTLGRIDERTENLERRLDERVDNLERRLDRVDERFDRVERRLDRVETDVKDIHEKMLTKATFFTFLSLVGGLLAAMIALQ